MHICANNGHIARASLRSTPIARSPFSTRPPTQHYPEEDNRLTDGSIIDLAGIQLLYHSATFMQHRLRESHGRHYSIIRRLNKRRFQCPVQMHTLRFVQPPHPGTLPEGPLPLLDWGAKDEGGGAAADGSEPAGGGGAAYFDGQHVGSSYPYEVVQETKNNRTPYVYPACGHVLAFAPELNKNSVPVSYASLRVLLY